MLHAVATHGLAGLTGCSVSSTGGNDPAATQLAEALASFLSGIVQLVDDALIAIGIDLDPAIVEAAKREAFRQALDDAAEDANGE